MARCQPADGLTLADGYRREAVVTGTTSASGVKRGPGRDSLGVLAVSGETGRDLSLTCPVSGLELARRASI